MYVVENISGIVVDIIVVVCCALCIVRLLCDVVAWRMYGILRDADVGGSPANVCGVTLLLFVVMRPLAYWYVCLWRHFIAGII